LICISVLLCISERTRTYDGGGVDRAPVVAVAVAVVVAEAGEEGAESRRKEKHL
jgi:hypothetical protein